MKNALIAIIIALAPVTVSAAADVVRQVVEVSADGTFTVGPAKIEVQVAPGETVLRSIVIENKLGRTQSFEISFEDFAPSNEAAAEVELVGQSASARSLVSSLFVPANEITLAQGERAIVPVSVTIPAGTPAGARYAAIVVSASGSRNALPDEERAQSGAVVVGRIASLVIANVSGDAREDGALASLSVIEGSAGRTARIVFRNNGETSLNPYGVIEVRNIFGEKVAETEVDPWFVLPESTRTRDLLAPVPEVLGMYEVRLRLNRGYGNVIDEAAVTVTVVPATHVAAASAVLILAFFVIIRRARAKKATLDA
jgi:hypothetical protein